ncbi:hypothetical protein H4W34_006371 [Actinomadura algeriensis]|uniref:Uncharacterized protein n=1 Tax=Actinomadura algeriensis TaxID=1679523 RepID=A0ABR9K1Q5_9ACTN|nr:hypothetical protein [Actinomadura algeriensis]
MDVPRQPFGVKRGFGFSTRISSIVIRVLMSPVT